jgi:hypothetical protein
MTLVGRSAAEPPCRRLTGSPSCVRWPADMSRRATSANLNVMRNALPT